MRCGRLARAIVLAAAGWQAGAVAAAGPEPGTAATVEQALHLAYDLDHGPAIALLRQAIAAHPDDASAHRALASVLWLNILFSRGAVTVDHYLGSLSRPSVDLPAPPAAIAGEFKVHIARAIAIAERDSTAQPRDVQALYDLGAALGIRASYVATVDGRLMAGFRAARAAFDAHERVLALDPSRRDAGLVVGTYRYLVSTLALPMRVMAYVAGFGGGRDRGIELLRGAAAMPDESRADALFALVLVDNREKRYSEALAALEELARLYPRNRLVLLEAGATALRGGQLTRAEQLLDRGLTMLASDARPRIPGEEQLWRYKRGAVRVAAGKLDDARADLDFAAGPGAAVWVQGRARVERGRAALLRGERAAARADVSPGRDLCAAGRDPLCEADARALLRRIGS